MYGVLQLSFWNAAINTVFKHMHTRSSWHCCVSSSHSNVLCELILPLFRTLLESLFWDAFLGCPSHVCECWQCLKIDSCSNQSSVLGIAKNHMAPVLVNVMDFLMSLSVLCPTASVSWTDALLWGIKHQAKVWVLPGKQHHITLPLSPSKSSDSLFSVSEAAQSEQSICDKKSKLALNWVVR